MKPIKKFFLRASIKTRFLLIYGVSTSVIGVVGIVFSSISFIGTLRIIEKLLKDKAYIVNGPYFAAAVFTAVICIVFVTWGCRSLIGGVQNAAGKSLPAPVPTEFDNYNEVENTLIRKQLPVYETGAAALAGKDKSFPVKFLILLSAVIMFLIVKSLLPDELFWDYHIYPGYFSFPFYFMIILAAVTALKAASLYIHPFDRKPNLQVSEEVVSIKGGGDPYTFEPGIENARITLQQNKAPNIVFRSGFSQTQGGIENTGKVEKKMFIETQPTAIPHEPHPYIYLYLSSAIVLFTFGFLFATRLPPDNISVLTVPTIAVGFAWRIVKGGILLYAGWDLLQSASCILHTHLYESIMVHVRIDGVYGKVNEKSNKAGAGSSDRDGILIRSDCRFKIYTTRLLSEIYTVKGKRHIIGMTVEKDSEKAEKLVIGAIENFEKEGITVRDFKLPSRDNRDITGPDILGMFKPVTGKTAKIK
jgi:hypothetical protein